MYKVSANSRQEYMSAARNLGRDLDDLDRFIRECAPALKPWFYNSGPDEPGMTFKMLSYGTFTYKPKKTTDDTVEWPVIGIAVQKNYISIYFSVTKDSEPIVSFYKADIHCERIGNNNFSFKTFDQLDKVVFKKLLKEAETIFKKDPSNPVRFKEL